MNCIYWNVWKCFSPLIAISVFVVIAVVSFVLYAYTNIKMFCLVLIQNRGKMDKTSKLQRMLYISILCQAICFLTSCLIPMCIAIGLLLLGQEITSISWLAFFLSFNFYEIFSYIILRVFIRCFRDSFRADVLKLRHML